MPIDMRETGFTTRLAAEADIAALGALMTVSIEALQRPFLDAKTIEASHKIMGLDRQLIADGTYFVVEETMEEARVPVGCGGWSRRRTTHGGDHMPGRDATLLDPARDAARVRAMYTRPDRARRGIGRMILRLCETAAAAEGFSKLELTATLAGVPLYTACGFHEVARFTDAGVPIVRMAKAIGQHPAMQA